MRGRFVIMRIGKGERCKYIISKPSLAGREKFGNILNSKKEVIKKVNVYII